MKTAEVQTKALSGDIVFVSQFLSEQAREVPLTKGGTFIGHDVCLLRGNESLTLRIPTAKGLTNTSQVKLLGFKRMTAVVVELTEYTHTKWGVRASGQIYPLES